MQILLDSSSWIMALQQPERLSRQAHAVIHDPSHTLHFSMASCWEIAVKVSIGRLRLPAALLVLLEEDPMDIVPIRLAHIARVEQLPLHHRDPFDRMLIAQAMEDNLTLLSSDRAFRAYGVSLIEA